MILVREQGIPHAGGGGEGSGGGVVSPYAATKTRGSEINKYFFKESIVDSAHIPEIVLSQNPRVQHKHER